MRISIKKYMSVGDDGEAKFTNIYNFNGKTYKFSTPTYTSRVEDLKAIEEYEKQKNKEPEKKIDIKDIECKDPWDTIEMEIAKNFNKVDINKVLTDKIKELVDDINSYIDKVEVEEDIKDDEPEKLAEDEVEDGIMKGDDSQLDISNLFEERLADIEKKVKELYKDKE